MGGYVSVPSKEFEEFSGLKGGRAGGIWFKREDNFLEEDLSGDKMKIMRNQGTRLDALPTEQTKFLEYKLQYFNWKHGDMSVDGPELHARP